MELKKRIIAGIILIVLGATVLFGLTFTTQALLEICPPFA